MNPIEQIAIASPWWVGVLNELKLNTESGASNYSPSVYYDKDWHYANITFVVEDKGILED